MLKLTPNENGMILTEDNVKKIYNYCIAREGTEVIAEVYMDMSGKPYGRMDYRKIYDILPYVQRMVRELRTLTGGEDMSISLPHIAYNKDNLAWTDDYTVCMALGVVCLAAGAMTLFHNLDELPLQDWELPTLRLLVDDDGTINREYRLQTSLDRNILKIIHKE